MTWSRFPQESRLYRLYNYYCKSNWRFFVTTSTLNQGKLPGRSALAERLPPARLGAWRFGRAESQLSLGWCESPVETSTEHVKKHGGSHWRNGKNRGKLSKLCFVVSYSLVNQHNYEKSQSLSSVDQLIIFNYKWAMLANR